MADFEDDPLWLLLRALKKDAHDGGGDPHTCDVRCPDPACGSQDVDVDGCYYVCRSCGVCLKERHIDMSAEWRNFANNVGSPDISRCGMPVNEMMPQSSITTTVSMVKGKCSRDVSRISRFQLWNAMPYKERSLYNTIDTLSVKMASHDITNSIVDEIKSIYKTIRDSNVVRGDKKMCVLAASFYIACKNQGVTRSASEVADIFGIDHHSVTRVCKRIQEGLRLKLPCSQASDFVHRFASNAKLCDQDALECFQLVSEVQNDDDFAAFAPPSLAAACIHYVCQRNGRQVTCASISEACGPSVVTITKVYKRLIAKKQ
jgi:transcription initiation factor TFIIB